jgi:hypothetical protein
MFMPAMPLALLPLIDYTSCEMIHQELQLKFQLGRLEP